jgi:flagellar hook-associated protein 1 FlgK
VNVSSVSAGTNGSNSIALAVASLGTKIFNTNPPVTDPPTPPDLIDGSFNAFFNKTVTTVAQQLSSANTRLEDQQLSEEMAINNRDQYSGVSQDEEITDMMKFQRSFQASARHINVIDTLLEQVVNRLGVG